jgi:two-component system OmpR family response regulator
MISPGVPMGRQAPSRSGGGVVKILVVEDNRETADYVVAGLREKGHDPSLSHDGQDGLVRAMGETWDALIVDRMLPGLDGLRLVHRLRGAGVDTPVLFLTAMDGIDDRVAGLDAGADDYLVKPFALVELTARINALGRRPRVPRGEIETTLRVADLEMDLLARRVQRAGQPINLQPRESRLLEYFMRHAGQVVTRKMLLENVWNFHFEPHTNIVECHVSRLRSKVNAGNRPELIHTVRAAGYVLREPE